MLFSVNPPFNADALSQCLTVFIAGAHTRRSANQKPGGTPTRKIGVLRGNLAEGETGASLILKYMEKKNHVELAKRTRNLVLRVSPCSLR